MSSQAGIWNHIMGFFGFPGETEEEAEDTKRFVYENREHVHSLGFMTFVLGKYSPVAFEPEKYGVDYYKNPEWDLALDYSRTAVRKSHLGSWSCSNFSNTSIASCTLKPFSAVK